MITIVTMITIKTVIFMICTMATNGDKYCDRYHFYGFTFKAESSCGTFDTSPTDSLYNHYIKNQKHKAGQLSIIPRN